MSAEHRDWTQALNPEQREAAAHVHGPILVLAGAGSGKTRVLTTRLALLIEEHGVAPERIFAVTFTNRAAQEMKHRVATMLRRDPSGLWIGTFHSLSARLLRREAERLGFSRNFTIYDEDDRLALIKRLLEQRNHSPKLHPPRAVQYLISAAKNRMQSPDALLATGPHEPMIQVAADIYRALGPALKQQNAMDFDDLMLHPLTLFREHPDRLAAYQSRFAFVLVDEFQDTNRAQYELVKSLGSHGNVFAVGDDDQSIYAWRGAEVRNMREFQRDFPSATLVRLEENYRSTQIILDTANSAIAPNTSRIGKTLRTRRKGGEAVTLLSAADERDEAEWIVRELGTRRRQGDWTTSQMAVLYRTNSQSRALEEAFRRAGVPYQLIGAISFYERREVKDLLAYARLLTNPQDNEAFLRSVGVPKRGIGDSSLQLLREAAERWQKPLLATAATADGIQGMRPNARESLRRFAELIEQFRTRLAERSPAAVLEEIITAIDYKRVLLDEGPEGADRWDNVRELVAGAANWSEVVTDEEESTPLERFLADAALLSSHDSVQGDEAGVTLMTVHTAKGLEWPVVVVAGLEDGLFPLARSIESTEGLEEERRLFYVALTRAKDKLYLTWARSRRRGGEIWAGMSSRFLETIPPGVVDERTTSSMLSSWSSRPSGRGTAWSGGRSGSGGGGGGFRSSSKPAAAAPIRSAAPSPPAPEEVSQDTPRYVKGERVRHRRFGGGTILGLAGTGKDLKVTVRFDNEEVGQKQLLVAYAGLERDWESA